MAKIGVLGGMGPAATADFLTKRVQLTPAICDQEHMPVVVANPPQVLGRSRAILGHGASPLAAMCACIDLLLSAHDCSPWWHLPCARRLLLAVRQ